MSEEGESLFARWNRAALIDGDKVNPAEAAARLEMLSRKELRLFEDMLSHGGAIGRIAEQTAETTAEASSALVASLLDRGFGAWPAIDGRVVARLERVVTAFREWMQQRYDQLGDDSDDKWADLQDRTHRTDYNMAFLRGVMQRMPFVPAIERYAGGRVRCVQAGLLVAEAGPNFEDQLWHRDFYGSDRKFINVFIYLVDGSADRAPTQVIPGSLASVEALIEEEDSFEDVVDGSFEQVTETVDLPPRKVERALQEFARERARDAVSMFAPRGGVVVWDGRLVHRGMRNRTGADRPCIYATYVAESILGEFDDSADYKAARAVDPLRSDVELGAGRARQRRAAIGAMRARLLSMPGRGQRR